MAAYDSKYVRGEQLAHVISKIKTLLQDYVLSSALAKVATSGSYGDLSNTPVDATQSASGLMSSGDKTKLDGIDTGANAYTHPSYTVRTGKPTGNQTPAFGGTFTVSQVASDTTGHVTSLTDRTVTIPSTTATTEAVGLMSAGDKSKLDGIATGANAYVHPSYTASSFGLTANSAPAFGDSVTFKSASSDASGHVSGTASHTLTIPNATATQSASGLFSADDKIKLDGIATSANNYSHPTYTAHTGVPTANQTPGFGGTFTVTQPVSDATGHITAMNSRTITIPSTTASSSAAGLMSASDKSKLDAFTIQTSSVAPASGTASSIITFVV